jgi:cytochrome c-type biogenesis protein
VTHLIASSGVNTTVAAAFAVGFVSFISPCVLPLVPGYLSAISGVSFADLQTGQSKRKVIGPALLFCLSFTVMFVALGMTATGVGRALAEHRLLIRHVAGIVIFFMGLLFVLTLFVPLFNREWRPEMLLSRAATGGPVVAGLAFAVAWLPCTGPTLGAILTAASTQSTVAKGGVLLAFYSAGLGVPFVLSALAFSRVTGFFRFFRDHYAVITVVSGAILMVMGVLLFTDELTRLNNQALSWLDSLGLNFFSNI